MSRRQRNTLIGVLLLGGAFLFIKRSFFLYGLTSEQHLRDIIKSVVLYLGGGENAEALLLETASAETALGTAVDTSYNVGMGLMQFDPIGFDDVKARTSQRNKERVKRCFGIDIDRVQYTELRYSPLLSVVFARLKYILVPHAIPDTLEGRAKYWKHWYNSELGAGTPEYYASSAHKLGVA